MIKSRFIYTAAIITAITGYSLSINGAPEPFQLMTEEEAQALQQQLSTLQGEEREQYRREAYQRLEEKAAAAGYAMPELPSAPEAAREPDPLLSAAMTAAVAATEGGAASEAETQPATTAPEAQQPSQPEQVATQAPSAESEPAAAEAAREAATKEVVFAL